MVCSGPCGFACSGFNVSVMGLFIGLIDLFFFDHFYPFFPSFSSFTSLCMYLSFFGCFWMLSVALHIRLGVLSSILCGL